MINSVMTAVTVTGYSRKHHVSRSINRDAGRAEGKAASSGVNNGPGRRGTICSES